MKPNVVSADVLFEEFRNLLKWEWVAGLGASERRFAEVAVRAARSGADLVGYLNYIHPYRAQVLGEREIAYLTNATPEDCKRRIARIVTLEPPVLVLADGQAAPDEVVSMCERAQIPMFSTQESAAFVIDVLRAYLSKHFADRTTMHGVFMDILGLGVLITGESGLGKSELGLELITRGNGLVADDAVDLYRINQTTIEGKCPELLQNLLEVRGIGLLDIRAIFGETAVRRRMRLKLIVHLVRKETLERDYERLPYEPLTQDVLGVPVLKVVIQVVAGRNIAVLVEAAVRNTILQLRGIGLLDIRAIFGETAVRRKMRLRLIVHLVRRETLERDYERMPYEPLYQDVLGVPVRKAVIQVVAGRNIAVLVEAAVRNTILQLRGIDTYQEFVQRHRSAMSRGE